MRVDLERDISKAVRLQREMWRKENLLKAIRMTEHPERLLYPNWLGSEGAFYACHLSVHDLGRVEILFLCPVCDRPMVVRGCRLAFGQWLSVRVWCLECETKKELEQNGN
jgi:hypothetical protein